MSRRMAWAGAVACVTMAATGCTNDDAAPPAPSPNATPTTPSAAPSSTPAPQTTAPPAAPSTTPAAAHPVSLQALMKQKYNGGNLRLARVLARNPAYTRYHVTYRSGSLTISGILNVPSTPGPHPALVLNHGYIDPAVYTNGRGLMREQDYLARRGYVVLHTDYRNHAQSSDDPRNELDLRLGYTEDVINAVLALRTSQYVDPDRIGLLGRSMGGGITYNVLVAQPGLVKAGVVFAPVSSNAVDNFNRWTRPDGPVATQILRAYGEPARNPAFWRNLSAVNFFGRITEPLLIHHGEADSTCPIAWSRTTLTALKSAGKDATMYTYPGEEHAFGPAWPTSMARTVSFLKQQGV
ncbi:alpha/beta hydrolase family protein [Kribbella shirazensis]|uniref:Dipeptidyl aminopeptidase/acylaminoacyl peptidase n=1 Tax=Kribbella shirazensis TaxID=1105143 RepID=A0A7X6A1S4_9ACTN|nr:alpha/beta fold hydrolase [Kribbella shirazensis]NIK58263.1 dipeptidyl aminopeptidase/acylaminoacyl peptidase [Kribbella shirazensis]